MLGCETTIFAAACNIAIVLWNQLFNKKFLTELFNFGLLLTRLAVEEGSNNLICKDGTILLISPGTTFGRYIFHKDKLWHCWLKMHYQLNNSNFSLGLIQLLSLCLCVFCLCLCVSVCVLSVSVCVLSISLIGWGTNWECWPPLSVCVFPEIQNNSNSTFSLSLLCI